MPLKCSYCFSTIPEDHGPKCPECNQYFLDPPVKVDYTGVEDKRCSFCGNNVHSAARFCRHCHKWLDELEQAVDDIEKVEGLGDD